LYEEYLRFDSGSANLAEEFAVVKEYVDQHGLHGLLKDLGDVEGPLPPDELL